MLVCEYARQIQSNDKTIVYALCIAKSFTKALYLPYKHSNNRPGRFTPTVQLTKYRISNTDGKYEHSFMTWAEINKT